MRVVKCFPPVHGPHHIPSLTLVACHDPVNCENYSISIGEYARRRRLQPLNLSPWVWAVRRGIQGASWVQQAMLDGTLPTFSKPFTGSHSYRQTDWKGGLNKLNSLESRVGPIGLRSLPLTWLFRTTGSRTNRPMLVPNLIKGQCASHIAYCDAEPWTPFPLHVVLLTW